MLKFRTKFSVRTRLGSKRKLLNKRTIQKIEFKTPPILIVDLDYIESLLNSRKSSKQSKYYNSNSILELYHSWLLSTFNLITPSGILFIASKATEFSNILNVPIIYGNIKNIIYTIKIKQLISDHLSILTNNLDLWILSSNSANISFLAIDSNNRVLLYNNKTGLEILSKFIGTYKIINKLRLSTLKYINLQYLYLLLFYIEITNKSETSFYFDGNYFKTLDKYSKVFLKSNGLGLDLITDAHKFLSYSFLTKPEYLDYFLLGNADHYELHLSRLSKLISLDISILLKLKQQYDKLHPITIIPLTLPIVTPKLDSDLSFYYNIWQKQNPYSSYKDIKKFAKIVKKYTKFSSYNLQSIIPTFSNETQKYLTQNSNSTISKNDDISPIESYVSNLISGLF